LNPEQEFDRRIAAIHGLNRARADAAVHQEAMSMDIRQAELQSMVDVFLGPDYDPVKRRQVEDLQVALHQQQAELFRRHQQADMSDEQYALAAKAVIKDAFKKCEKILGQEDFRKLFGSSPHEAAGLIDKAAFLGKSSSD
jgi:hypothetical protein